MSNKKGIGSEIQCPFFRALRDRSIICESPERSAISSSIFFETQSRKASHILWHCNSRDGAGCPMYAAVMKKYEKDKKR